MKHKKVAVFALMVCLCGSAYGADDTLPPLVDGVPPRSFDEMWENFDPRSEPLDIEAIREWEEDGVVLSVVRFRIGTFKGQTSTLAAVYGYPEGGSQLPGLVQIHGGGQFADYRAPLLNAKRGYATISIAWAGRIAASDYLVDKDVVALFWAGQTNDPAYKLTTDWGALDAYHAPCRNPTNAFASVAPAMWTLDEVDSPRNNPWFLCTLAARRALTFLERQPEVDPEKLGVYGHSMGGKLTVMTAAADKRVKAAAPSCGGVSDRGNDSPLYRTTIGDDVNLKHISCPIIFLSPANDFHGRINDLQRAIQEFTSNAWRLTCSAHHNHQDNAEFEVASLLWFDQYLKGAFRFPQTPQSSLVLKTEHGIPTFTVRPDASEQILAVDIYYTQQGQLEGEKNDHENTMNRFWHHAVAEQDGDTWTANLPLFRIDRPLWVYANILYPLAEPVTGAGYYYRPYTAKAFNLSSQMQAASPGQLAAAGVKATAKPTLVIETFEGDWEKAWFTYKPDSWDRRTHKIHDDQWRAPADAKLAFEVRSAKSNMLVVGIDEFAAEVAVEGGGQWQSVTLAPTDFRDANGDALSNWDNPRELRLGAAETLRSAGSDSNETRVLGGAWDGSKPEFRILRWIGG